MSRKVFRRDVTFTSTTLNDVGEIGDRREQDGNTYRLVYTSASLASPAVVTWASATDSQAYEVALIAVAESEAVFGVNNTGATVPALSYFWAMVEGVYTIVSTQTSNSTLTAASPITMIAGEKFNSWLSSSTNVPYAYAIKAIASNAGGDIYLKGAGA